MNEQVTEHRGWPPSAPVHSHYLDDPYWDFADDGADGQALFWVWLACSMLMLAGYGCYMTWGG